MTLFASLAPPLALATALVGTPWLLARLLVPRSSWITHVAAGGVGAIVLGMLVPIGLHVSNVPIRPVTLAIPHLATFAVALALFGVSGRRWRPGEPAPRAMAWLALALIVLVAPCTRLAGIDTYKWQGLATNVGVEACVPWLVHPASLFGFTPRAYPPAQPLILATTQILGGLGVELGFYLTSLVTALTGLCLAYLLGRKLFALPAHAVWFAGFYVFSPVFMRYAHWATGRGMCLALLPLLLLALVQAPRLPALVGLPLACLLLMLTHKAGMVAVLLLVPASLASALLPRLKGRWLPIVLALPCVAAAVLLSPPFGLAAPAGLLPGFVRTAITRFGWMLPMAALGLVVSRDWLTQPSRRRLLPALLGTLPLAFPPDMYGAMLALPFVTFAATVGFSWMLERWPERARGLGRAAVLLTAAGALAVVLNRNLHATPPRVYRAARFLESYDPRGPYQIHAPGRARTQMHAYVSGCPRFVVRPSPESRLNARDLPSLEGPVQEVARRWIAFGREAFELGDVAIAWYGNNPRQYYVCIDGVGDKPPTGDRLYAREGIEIHQPLGQVVTPDR